MVLIQENKNEEKKALQRYGDIGLCAAQPPVNCTSSGALECIENNQASFGVQMISGENTTRLH